MVLKLVQGSFRHSEGSSYLFIISCGKSWKYDERFVVWPSAARCGIISANLSDLFVCAGQPRPALLSLASTAFTASEECRWKLKGTVYMHHASVANIFFIKQSQCRLAGQSDFGPDRNPVRWVLTWQWCVVRDLLIISHIQNFVNFIYFIHLRVFTICLRITHLKPVRSVVLCSLCHSLLL